MTCTVQSPAQQVAQRAERTKIDVPFWFSLFPFLSCRHATSGVRTTALTSLDVMFVYELHSIHTLSHPSCTPYTTDSTDIHSP